MDVEEEAIRLKPIKDTRTATVKIKIFSLNLTFISFLIFPFIYIEVLNCNKVYYTYKFYGYYRVKTFLFQVDGNKFVEISQDNRKR